MAQPSAQQLILDHRIRDWAVRLSLGGEEKRLAWEEYLGEALTARWTVRNLADDPTVNQMLLEKCQPVYDESGRLTSLAGFWFWVRTFGVVDEPRPSRRHGGVAKQAFIPWFHQEELMSWCWELMLSPLDETGLVLKSRDQGATWAILHLFVWAWLFLRDVHILIASQKEELVDKAPGTANIETLFGRLELILKNQPGWLLPPAFDLRDTKFQRQMLWLRNKANGNTFYGTPANAALGRQNRFWGIMIDEFDHIDNAEQIFGGTADSAAWRILVTTPNRHLGQRSMAWRIKEAELAHVFESHWYAHPYKDREWYDREGKRRFAEDLGSELDLSWEGSDKDLIYPTWKRVPAGDFPYRPGWPTSIGLDFGRTDGTSIDWVQRNPVTGRWRWLASYYNVDWGIEGYLPFFGLPIQSGKYEYTDEDLDLVKLVAPWARGAQFYGDPSGEQVHQAADRSVAQILRAHRIYVKSAPGVLNRHAERQSRLREILLNSERWEPHTRLLDAAFRNYRKAVPRKGTLQPTRRPIHDWSSHPVTAAEYIAVNAPALRADDTQSATPIERHKAAWERRAG